MRLHQALIAVLLLLPLAASAPHPDYPQFAAPIDTNTLVDRTLTVADTAVYEQAWYSVDGASWQPLPLDGTRWFEGSQWLKDTTTTLPELGSGVHYLAVYSCSYHDGWDCHDGWQLHIIKNNGTTHHIVKEGAGQADIIIAPDAPNTVNIAADELQTHIHNITGATLPIRNTPDNNTPFHIYIGQSNYTDTLGVTDEGCKHGSFKIVTGKDHLVLLGNDDPDTVSGPHTVRWNSEIPSVLEEWDNITGDTWDTPYTRYYKNYNPDLDIREPDNRGSLNAVYKLLRDQGVRWYYPGSIGTIIPDKENITIGNMNKHVKPDFARRDQYILCKRFVHGDEDYVRWKLRMGLNVGDEITGTDIHHGLNYVTSREETKAEHPEYYAIWDGERMDGDNHKQNLCSEGLLNETAEYVRTMYDTYDMPMIKISPADGFTRASESSEECKNMETPERGYDGRMSDYVWEFINNLAWKTYETHPDKKIHCGAYALYQLPPQNLSKPVAPNLVVSIARWRSSLKDPQQKEFYRNLTETWQELLPSNEIYIRDYYLHNWGDNERYLSIPVVYPHVISEDLKYLKGKSRGEFIEVAANCKSMDLDWDSFTATALNSYITSRLYWDADQDVDAILQEYYDRYYGPAADKMEEFYNYSETHYPEAPNNPEILVNLRNMAEEAQAIAGEDTIYGKRIDKLLELMNGSYIGEETTIDSCQTLDSPSTTYKLTQDVSSSGTCFTITNDGITIDCQGHTITYATSNETESEGIYVDEESHYNITNCHIREGTTAGRYGIHAYISEGGVVEDTTIDISGLGVFAHRGSGFHARGNTITSSSSNAIYAANVPNSTIEYNELTSTSSPGLQVSSSHNSTITGNNITSSSDWGFHLYNTNKSTLTDNRFKSDTKWGLFASLSSENTFIDNHAESRDSSAFTLYTDSDDNLVIGQSASGGDNGIFVRNNEGNTFQDCGTIVGGVRDEGTGTEFINCTW